jgi:toxin ParE1/3/4
VNAKAVFAPEAEMDIQALYDFLSDCISPDRAIAYTDRILAYCEALTTFPRRGRPRDYLRPGLRTFSFDRILYGGRDFERIPAAPDHE